MQIGRLYLIKSDDPKARVVGIGRVGQRYGKRPDGAGDKARSPGGVGNAVGPRPTLLGRLEVEIPGELVQELVFEDRAIKFGVLATAGLARIVDEKFALRDAGGA